MIGKTNGEFNLTPKIVSWGGGTIQEISKMLDAHYKGRIDISDYWAVGDSRTENISEIPSGTTSETQSAQSIELVIIGMNHDDLATPVNGISKAAITVQTKECLKTSGYMTSAMGGASHALWSNTERRVWCNNEFINALTTLRGLVKPVVKLTNRYADGNYSSDRQQETTEDYVFLLSQWEVWGMEQMNGAVYYVLPADGTQYEYMKTESNRIKSINGGAFKWWTRTSFIYKDGRIYTILVVDTGEFSDGYTARNTFGLAPAFCL